MPARRSFTIEQKEQLLDEAAQADSSYSLVSKKHGVTTAQLFTWRRELRRGPAPALRQIEAARSESHLLDQIAHFENMISPLVLEKLVRDIRTGDVSAYNASTAYSSIVGAFCKLASLKLEVLDKLRTVAASAPVVNQKSAIEIENNRKVEQFAERLLIELASKPNYGQDDQVAAMKCDSTTSVEDDIVRVCEDR